MKRNSIDLDNIAHKFQEDGFVVISDYASPAEIADLRAGARQIIDNLSPDTFRIFSTENQSEVLDNYFIESGDKVRCFFEENAFDESGELQVRIELAVNKIGHAMHDLIAVFESFSYKRQLLEIATALGLQKPAIAQSQYIFKQPRIGAKVNPHTDSTFIYTEPLSCLGAWVALEDANQENGCLSVLPGSHKHYPLQQQYVRSNAGAGTAFIDTPHPRAHWPVNKLMPLEVREGSLVLLHGTLVHASYANRSAHSRQAYIMHLIDLKSKWSKQNWLQRPANMPFRYFAEVLRSE